MVISYQSAMYNQNYKEYLDSYAWKSIKKTKLEENPKCECCWINATTVHHLSYERIWRERSDDVVSICESCHYECHHVWGYQIKNEETLLRKRFNEVRENHWGANLSTNPWSNSNDKEIYLKWPDQENIEYLNDSFVKDKSHVYYINMNNVYFKTSIFEMIEDADIGSFKIINKSYAKDKSHVYRWSSKIDWADSDSFITLNDWYVRNLLFDWDYSKDKNFVYSTWIVIQWADPNTFELLSDRYAKDKNRAYRLRLEISGVDLGSFKVINDDLSKDKYNVYEYWDILLWANPNDPEFK